MVQYVSLIYHILADEPVAHDDRYQPLSLRRDGFIHCTRQRDEVLAVAARFFADCDRLIVWCIDEQRVTSPIADEPGADRPSVMFPHIYGPLNMDAVVGRAALVRNADGHWHWTDDAFDE